MWPVRLPVLSLQCNGFSVCENGLKLCEKRKNVKRFGEWRKKKRSVEGWKDLTTGRWSLKLYWSIWRICLVLAVAFRCVNSMYATGWRAMEICTRYYALLGRYFSGSMSVAWPVASEACLGIRSPPFISYRITVDFLFWGYNCLCLALIWTLCVQNEEEIQLARPILHTVALAWCNIFVFTKGVACCPASSMGDMIFHLCRLMALLSYVLILHRSNDGTHCAVTVQKNSLAGVSMHDFLR